MQHKTQQAVLTALRQCGSMSVRELQKQLGPRSRGTCTMHVLDYFVVISGLSSELRTALSCLLWAERVELVPVRGRLRLRLSR